MAIRTPMPSAAGFANRLSCCFTLEAKGCVFDVILSVVLIFNMKRLHNSHTDTRDCPTPNLSILYIFVIGVLLIDVYFRIECFRENISVVVIPSGCHNCSSASWKVKLLL